jgi:hypothetical protein
MASVPHTNPERQPVITLQALPPLPTTGNGRRSPTPAPDAEIVLRAELEGFRADCIGAEREEPGPAFRQRHIPIWRPASDVWVRVEPTWSYAVHLYQPSKSLRDPYVVHPAVVSYLGNKAKLVDLRQAIDSDGLVFFWPNHQGDEFAAHITEREAITAATTTWIRLQWNPGTKAFDYEEAPTDQPLPEPAWPPVPVLTLLGRALEKKKIASPDHPIIQALLAPGGRR